MGGGNLQFALRADGLQALFRKDEVPHPCGIVLDTEIL